VFNVAKGEAEVVTELVKQGDTLIVEANGGGIEMSTLELIVAAIRSLVLRRIGFCKRSRQRSPKSTIGNFYWIFQRRGS